MEYPRFILAGTHSGVGKTTITLGIILALKKRGLCVQSFKAGPDYIDPSYYTLASGKISRNLDNWMLPKETIRELFERQAKTADISIIEGVMGLYDGLMNTEEGSTAQLAKILASPVILMVDASSMSRSAGAVVLGYKRFDKNIDIKGVILNNIGSASHYSSIKDSIEKKAKIPVLGFLPREKNLILPQRHLGLIPTNEKKLPDAFAEKLLNLIEKNIDIDRIIRISHKTAAFPQIKKRLFGNEPSFGKVSIAVAKDAAFNFYYQDNLDILKYYGANIVEFSPLKDKRLPLHVNGLYIGGGFPELFASQLAKNVELKKDIYIAAKNGLPIYAECGGLMYLVKWLIDFKKRKFPMVGIFKGSVSMDKKIRALGYVEIETIKDNILSKKGAGMRGHMFHWSYLDNIPKDQFFAYRIKKNQNEIFYDGLVKNNVFASYAHLHFASDINLAKNFIKKCQEYKAHI